MDTKYFLRALSELRQMLTSLPKHKAERKRQRKPRAKRGFAILSPMVAQRRRSRCCDGRVEDKPRGATPPFSEMRRCHCATCGAPCETRFEKEAA